MLHHLEEAWIGAEQILPEVSSALDEIFLVLAVADFTQTPHQQTIAIGANQTVPVRTPNYFDYIPSRAAEDGLQFLNDLSIAPDWSVEALQVAIHHEDQVVQILA